jgi:hypothetical protein
VAVPGWPGAVPGQYQGQRQEHESVSMIIQPYFVAIHTTIVRCALCIWSWQYSVSPPSARHASLATRN